MDHTWMDNKRNIYHGAHPGVVSRPTQSVVILRVHRWAHTTTSTRPAQTHSALVASRV